MDRKCAPAAHPNGWMARRRQQTALRFPAQTKTFSGILRSWTDKWSKPPKEENPLPDEPSGLSQLAATGTSIIIQWYATGSSLKGCFVMLDGKVEVRVPYNGRLHERGPWRAKVSGLQPSRTYTLEVCAVTAAGQGKPSQFVGRTAMVPESPEDLTQVNKTPTSVTISWYFSSPDGGIPPRKCLVKLMDQLVEELPFDGSVHQKGCWKTEVVGLQAGTRYTFDVSVVNEVGEGVPASISVATADATGPPNPAFVKFSTATSVTLVWRVRVPPRGSSLVKCLVRRDEEVVADVPYDPLMHVLGWWQATISDLIGTSRYTFKISAVSTAGEGCQATVEAYTTLALVEPKELWNPETCEIEYATGVA